MKKYSAILILIIILLVPNIVYSEDTFKFAVNGEEIQLSVNPVTEGRIIWVPVLEIFESLGFDIDWYKEDGSISIVNNRKKIQLRTNSIKVIANNEEIILESPVKSINDTLMIPLSFITKVLPVKIEVNKENNQIAISDFPCGLLLTAKSHILVEPESGLIFLDHYSHERLRAGNLNKVMNMLLIFEALESREITLADMVIASKQASGASGSQIFLADGEQQSVEALVKSMLIIGANDSAVAMAEYIAGSETAFVDLMNKKAQSLGLKDTHYVNVTGLDSEDQYTSAYDMAIMVRELVIKYPEIIEISSSSNEIIQKPGSSKVSFHLTNTNKMLENYPGCNGLITGYTANASFCLAGTAKRSGLQFIVLVMGAAESETRYEEASALFDYGFDNFRVLEREPK